MKHVVLFLIGFSLLAAMLSAQVPVDERQRLDAVQKEFVSFFKSKEFGKAIKPGEEIVELSIRLFGADSENVAVAYANLSTVYRERLKYKEAVEQMQRAADLRSRHSNWDAKKRIHVLGLLAGTQALAGDRDGAKANYQLALDLTEKSFGKGDREALEPTLNMANFFALSSDFQQADEFYLKSLKIAHEKFGDKAAVEKEMVENARGCLTDPTRVKPETREAYQAARKSFFDESDHGDGLNKLTVLPRPDYPMEARRQGLGGMIAVRVEVDEEGRVAETNAVCGHPVLAASAEEAARKARFKPTMKDGKAIRITGMLIYNFVAAR